MELINEHGLPLLRFRIFEQYPELIHAVTTRQGGCSSGQYESLNLGVKVGDALECVAENRRRLAAALKHDLDSVITPVQVHGNSVLAATSEFLRGGARGLCSIMPPADGLVTNMPGLLLMIKIADCYPVFLVDARKQAVGLVHAGWRGTASGIVEQGIKALAQSFGSDPHHLLAGIGPGIGRCCFTVGSDVVNAFADRSTARKCWRERCAEGRYRFDLQGAIYAALRSCGLQEKNIELADACTYCRNDLFFSHRRDRGMTGRMAAVVGLRSA